MPCAFTCALGQWPHFLSSCGSWGTVGLMQISLRLYLIVWQGRGQRWWLSFLSFAFGNRERKQQPFITVSVNCSTNQQTNKSVLCALLTPHPVNPILMLIKQLWIWERTESNISITGWFNLQTSLRHSHLYSCMSKCQTFEMLRKPANKNDWGGWLLFLFPVFLFVW